MNSLAIRGGVVHLDGECLDADVTIEGSVIAEVGAKVGVGAAQVVDATDCAVLPGFVDLQVNGAVGVDFTTQPERIGEVAAFLVQCGVTSFMPTVISTSASQMATAIAAINEWSRGAQPGARSLGIHLEGPFLNPQRCGAHPPQHLRPPSLADAEGWTRAAGVSMVTIAPELPQALHVIRQLIANGVSICAGHTEASVADMRAASIAGLRGVTHLFNAMSPMSARSPGPAGSTFADPALIAGVIVDGIHVDPLMVRLAWHALGPSRFALVSDAIAALGLPNGAYSIGDTHVVLDETGVRTSAGVLAGSVLHFDEAVRNLMAFTGCELAEASMSASATPARLAQRSDIGRLAPGSAADPVVLDETHRVVVTVVGGHVAFDPQQRCSGS
jgi:N-acetylglucosamine-6-phosphate deacetylase